MFFFKIWCTKLRKPLCRAFSNAKVIPLYSIHLKFLNALSCIVFYEWQPEKRKFWVAYYFINLDHIAKEGERKKGTRAEVGFHKFRGNLKLYHWNERARERGTEIYLQCRRHSGFPLLIRKFGRPRFFSLSSYASDIRPHYSTRSEFTGRDCL